MGMIVYRTGKLMQETHSFKGLQRFDGIVIESTNLDFITVLPISSYEYRSLPENAEFYESRQSPFVRLSKGPDETEFLIKDDWGDDHLLIIPNEMCEIIEASKKAILQNRIPANF